jgi:outer membrane protein assembly factor BamB
MLHTVDTASGSARWSFRTGGEQRHDFWDFYLSDPLVHGSSIMFGSGGGHVYALNRHTGEERWRFRTGSTSAAATTTFTR